LSSPAQKGSGHWSDILSKNFLRLAKPCRSHAGTTQGDYPLVRVGKTTKRVSRIVLEQTIGRPIRLGYCALHHCDNPKCVEPTHLYEGTKKQNMQDCLSRGRHIAPRGEKQHRAKLTAAKVRVLRASKKSSAEFARLYGVQISAICKARRGDTWGHV
jgi:hypothetical protein